MSLENGSTIASLSAIWPLSGDNISEGDDHIRLIKAVLKAQFPGASNNGFSKAIVATEDELNRLQGVTSNVQNQITNLKKTLGAPAGTVMLFAQNTTPVGWSVKALSSDSLLRLSPSSGGLTGGSDNPISLVLQHSHTTGDHALTIAEMPAHSHNVTIEDARGSGSEGAQDGTGGFQTATTTVTGSGNSHNHGNTGSALENWTPRYTNVILGVKD